MQVLLVFREIQEIMGSEEMQEIQDHLEIMEQEIRDNRGIHQIGLGEMVVQQEMGVEVEIEEMLILTEKITLTEVPEEILVEDGEQENQEEQKTEDQEDLEEVELEVDPVDKVILKEVVEEEMHPDKVVEEVEEVVEQDLQFLLLIRTTTQLVEEQVVEEVEQLVVAVEPLGEMEILVAVEMQIPDQLVLQEI